mgnify:CR=1 FL=1
MKENTFLRSFKLVPEVHRPFFFASMIAMVGTGVRMIGPQLISRGIDNGVMQYDYQYLLVQCLFYFLTLVVLYFVTSKALLSIGLVGESYVKSIREKLFRHMSSIDINYFEKNKTGVLVARMTSDMQSLNEFAREGASSILTSLLTIFGATIAVFLVDVQLSLLSFLILPLLGIATKIFRNHADKTYWSVREWIGQVLSSLQEGISGVRIIQAYADESKQLKRFKEVNNEHLKANMQSAKNIAIYFPFLEITRVTSIAVVIWFAAARIEQGTLTVGELVALLFYLNYFFDPLIQLSFNYDLLRSAGSSMKKVFSILDEEPVLSKTGTLSPEVDSNNVIKFENVEFSYGRETVLHDVSFSIDRGEKIAIVGATGSGKSTMIKLILRLYDLENGVIKINNKNIKNYKISDLRSSISLVNQDIFLFADSIFNNITLFNDKISKKEVEEAAKNIGVLEFINKLPGGLNYNVKERGVMLSEGQRQIISFLRAYVSVSYTHLTLPTKA